MTYPDFENQIIFLKNSVSPETQLNTFTVKQWYEIYFKFYEKEQLEKVFRWMAETGIQPLLKNILESIEQYYGYQLHREIEKARKIVEQAKLEKVDYKNGIPELTKYLDRPQKQAWDYVMKEEKK